MPTKKDETAHVDFSHTIYPDGLETIPQRFAISKRNEWMLKQADIVVAYVIHSSGGAATFTSQAEKRGKIVINLAMEIKK